MNLVALQEKSLSSRLSQLPDQSVLPLANRTQINKMQRLAEKRGFSNNYPTFSFAAII